LKTRGHPIDGHNQRLAVRLARGQKSQHSYVILYEGPLASGGAAFKKPPRFVSFRSEETAHSDTHQPEFIEDPLRRPRCICGTA
jgi:hypothetical protein